MESTAVEGSPDSAHAPRKRTGRLEQVGHLAAWGRSGLSAQAYGNLYGLEAATLYRWRMLEKKRGRRRLDQADDDDSRPEPEQQVGFVSFDVEGSSLVGEGAGARVRMSRGGLELEVSGIGSERKLVGLLRLLREEVLDA